MSAFIVSGGSLLEVGCPSSLNRETAQQVSFTSTLGGRRKAFVRKGGRRSWSIDVSTARPGEVSTIEAVARNLGPVGWYGPEAVIGNLLSPQASAFDTAPANSVAGGLVQLPDGTVASTIAHTGSGRVPIGGGEIVPVRSGAPITIGVWALGSVRFWGTWRNNLGASLGAWSSVVYTHTGWQWREYTLTPLVGATGVDIEFLSGNQYAIPSVAWGTVGRPELGTGCPRAVIHSPSHSPVALWKGANYTDSSYSVTEVG